MNKRVFGYVRMSTREQNEARQVLLLAHPAFSVYNSVVLFQHGSVFVPDCSENRVCVLGGAFNPPTVAHVELLLAGMKLANASRGFFLPANGAYLRIKLSNEDFSFSDSEREKMLACICSQHEGLFIDRRELELSERAYTYDTLVSMRQDLENAEIYFIIGSDKLHTLPRWYKSAELLKEFHIIAAGRADELTDLPEGIIPLTPSKELSGISASAFRAHLRAGELDKARGMLPPEAWEACAQTATFDSIMKNS